MTQLDPSSLASFASDLTKPALQALSDGYVDLVEKFERNAELKTLVEEVGIQQALTSENSTITALQKKNKELVTSAEKIAEKTMRDLVLKSFPQHALIGEELGSTAGDEYLWVFDPVDGTSAMIRTAMAQAFRQKLDNPVPSFGITIAVVHAEEAIVGVVGQLVPESGVLSISNLWVGANGQKSTINGQEIVTPTPRSLAQSRLASTVPEVMFATHESWGQFQGLLDSAGELIVDQNCVGFMHLLTGDVDIVMERDMTLPDAAALVPILRNANITVTDHDGQPVRFDKEALDGEYLLLAAHPELHTEAIGKVRAGVTDGLNRFTDAGSIVSGYAQKFPA